jgi:hypothetical protein
MLSPFVCNSLPAVIVCTVNHRRYQYSCALNAIDGSYSRHRFIKYNILEIEKQKLFFIFFHFLSFIYPIIAGRISTARKTALERKNFAFVPESIILY